MSANKMLEMEIRAAYIFLRENNHTIPSDTLQFMLDASLEKLNSVKDNEVLDPVSKLLPTTDDVGKECEKQIKDWLLSVTSEERHAYRVAFRRSFEYVLRKLNAC